MEISLDGARGARPDHSLLATLTRIACALVLCTALFSSVAVADARAGDPPDDSTPVVLEGDPLRQALFLAIEAQRLGNSRFACEEIPLQAIALQLFTGGKQPSSSPSDLAGELIALRDAYRNTYGTNACDQRFMDEGILDFLRFAEASSELSAAVKRAVQEVARRALELSSALGNGIADRGLTALDDLGQTIALGVFGPQAMLARAFQLALANTAFAQLRDLLFGQAAGISITANLQALLDHAVIQASGLLELIQNGRLEATYGVIAQAVQGALDKLAQARDQVIANIGAYVTGALTPNQLAALNAARENLMRAQSALVDFVSWGLQKASTASAIAGEKLAAAGKVFAGIGRAVTTVTRAFSRVLNRALERGIGGISYVGVAQALGSALKDLLTEMRGGTYQDKDDRITDSLVGLREDIAALRTEMNARFDRLDLKLDEIYSEMITRFDEVNAKLDQLDQNVTAIRDGVVRLSSQIQRLERNVYQLFKDSQNRELWTQINTAVGWRERSVGGAPMSNEQFLNFEGFFFSWITQSAYDTIAVGPASRTYDEPSIVDELATIPLEGNLGYVSTLGNTTFGLPKLSNNPLPNLRDFAVAARAYSALLMENPDYVTDGIRARVDSVIARGRQVVDALAAIGVRDVPGVGTGNATLNKALDFYRRSGTAAKTGETHSVASALSDVENEYIASLQSVKGNPLGINPWGGRSQDSPMDSDVPYTIGICKKSSDFNAPTLQTPSNFNDRGEAFGPMIRNAIRMGAGEARATCRITASNQREVKATTGSRTDYFADFTVEFLTQFKSPDSLFGAFDSTLVLRKVFPDVNWCTGFSTQDCTTLDPFQEVLDRWPAGLGSENWKQSFEQSATTTEPLVGGISLEKAVDKALRARQQDGYQYIGAEMSDAPLRTPLKRLTGAKSLLEAYVEFGLWRDLFNDGELRELLYGEEQLLSEGPDELISGMYLQAALDPPSGNVRQTIVGLLDSRATKLETKLAEIIDAVNPAAVSTRAGADEFGLRTNPLIETTLARLVLTKNLPAPSAEESEVTPTPTPTPTTTPTPTPTPEKPVDPEDPMSSLEVGKARLRSLTKGLPMAFFAARAGKVTATLKVSRSTAKKLKLPRSGVIAKAEENVAPGAARMLVRATGKAAKRLRKATKVQATLTVVFTDSAGAKQTLTRKLTLKR